MTQHCGKHLLISYEATLKRARRNILAVIDGELLFAEQVYKSSLLQSNSNNVLKLKYEYNSILGEQIGKTLFGDKPPKLLARQLKGEQVK